MLTIQQRVILLLGLLLWLSHSAVAQDEDEDPYLPGLIAAYRDSGNATVNRIDPAISFSWLERSPDRRLAAGPFSADWRGFLVSQANGPYQFHAYGAGQLRITLNDQVIIEAKSEEPAWHSSKPLNLSYAYHPLHVEYKSVAKAARLSLFWSGPQFQLEPLDGRQLFHDRKQTIAPTFSRGEELVRALRCAACHELAGEPASIPAPALDRLGGMIEHDWLTAWLAGSIESNAGEKDLQRRMPHFQLSAEDAQSMAAFLLKKSLPVDKRSPIDKQSAASKNREKQKEESNKEAKNKKKKNSSNDEPVPPPKTPTEAGRELVLTLGCLACHRVGQLGHSDLFGGGDLSAIAAKRPANFFELWLATPETLNAQHRMPVFDLTIQERRDISTYLATLRPIQRATSATAARNTDDLVAQGEKLFAEHRCGACHASPLPKPAIAKSKISAKSNWSRACIENSVAKNQPRYQLGSDDRRAVQEFVTKLNPSAGSVQAAGTFLRERGCVACHWRDDSPGLAPWLTAVAEKNPDLAPQLPAMTPPPLISVGDKLNERALEDAIRREGRPLREYLRVRMPKFAIADAELKSLIDELVTADRIPPNAPRTSITSNTSNSPEKNTHSDIALDAVGTRLVTPDGFGCTSCHQIGRVLPAKAPLNARGADLTMLGRRTRKEWFDRWVRNPSRIIPRMEMPSVQVAVRGVLDENLDAQLAAVWDVLNRPGFEPPEPNPVRIVRQTGSNSNARAVWISDVVRTKSEVYIKPLLIGLANRHNLLFDLETARLAGWSMGDVARQRTEGKSWYWELAGKELYQRKSRPTELTVAVEPEFALVQDGREVRPINAGQFVTEFDSILNVENRIEFRHRLHFKAAADESQLTITQSFSPIQPTGSSKGGGFRRKIVASGLPRGTQLQLRLVGDGQTSEISLTDSGRSLAVNRGEAQLTIRIATPAELAFQPDGSLRSAWDPLESTCRHASLSIL